MIERRIGERIEDIRKIHVISEGTVIEVVLLDRSTTGARFISPFVSMAPGHLLQLCIPSTNGRMVEGKVVRQEVSEAGYRIAVMSL